MANLGIIDTEVAQLLLAAFDAELRSIWSEMARELAGYVTAHVDPADRSVDDVEAITSRALELADAATVRLHAALELAYEETERQIFDEAPLQ